MLPDFSTVRALVVGDLILDRYHYGSVSRVSPEAPVQLVQVEHSEDRPGGAAYVAANIAALGASVHLLGFSGADDEGKKLQALVQRRGIHSHFIPDADSRTSIKTRVIGRNQQLLRFDVEKSTHRYHTDQLQDQFAELLPAVNIVILSDYAKGCLAEVVALIKHARHAGVPVFVDPKQADFGVYRGATVLTPNWQEFLQAADVHGQHDAIWQVAESFRQRLELQALLITHGGQGMHLLEQGREILDLPAKAREVYDVTGAGDTVIAVTACAYRANGGHLPAAVRLANYAAGLVVEKLGTATVHPAELAVAAHPPSQTAGIHSEAEMVDLVAQAKRNGERIVMTNGCFDVLHAGHVHYLRQAADLGDRLIVAVNGDDSVRALKGDGRPLNKLIDRMQVLTALAMVDWVVSFSETTPERLIARLLPDVLVKGGDYQAQELAGYHAVINNGGQVKVLSYQEGHSSSALIDRLRLS